jgi:hypothetical protein
MLKQRHSRSVNAALVITVLIGVLVATPAAALADAGGPTITGSITTPAGAAVGGAEVHASVEPSPQQMTDAPAGAELVPTPIGSTMTDADGAFALTVTDIRPLVAATDEDGLASVVLDSATPEGQVFYRLRLKITGSELPTANTADIATDGNLSASGLSSIVGINAASGPAVQLVTTDFTPDSATPASMEQAGEAFASSERAEAVRDEIECALMQVAGAGCIAPEPTTDTSPAETIVKRPRTDQPAYGAPGTPTFSASRSGGLDGDIWCGGEHWFLRKSKDVATLHPTLMNQATGSKTKGTFKYETTKSTSLEIGVTNKAGNIVATLGMTKGKTTTASVSSSIGKKVNAEWWISYDFNLFDVMCQNRTTLQKWWSGYTELRPKGFGGSSSRRNWKQFTCQSKYKSSFGEDYTATVAKGVTTTRTGSFTWGSTAAGNMKLSQTWGSTQTVSYSSINSTTSFSLCGYKGKWFQGVTKTRQV